MHAITACSLKSYTCDYYYFVGLDCVHKKCSYCFSGLRRILYFQQAVKLIAFLSPVNPLHTPYVDK